LDLIPGFSWGTPGRAGIRHRGQAPAAAASGVVDGGAGRPFDRHDGTPGHCDARQDPLSSPGYLILENGIYTFGLILVAGLPGLIEMGVLLDIFVGIFIMGTVIEHIRREFGSMSAYKLANLKE